MPPSIFQPDLLENKVAIVTGGGTGIGIAIARALGHMGATVVIASRKAKNIEPAAAGLSEELGREVIGLTCDIRDRERVRAFVGEVLERTGRIDVLVNNGGGQFMAPAETISDRGWDAVIATNLTGTWTLSRAVADQWMLANGGAIINITMLTQRGFPGMAHSVSARAGVDAMTRTLAVEWAPYGIRLNCVEPGIIASSGMLNYPGGRELAYEMQREIPMKRLGSCQEVAWQVAFLASPAGAYTTGQTFIVDGGRTLWGNTWAIPETEPPPVDIRLEPWQEER